MWSAALGCCCPLTPAKVAQASNKDVLSSKTTQCMQITKTYEKSGLGPIPIVVCSALALHMLFLGPGFSVAAISLEPTLFCHNR